MRKVPEEQEESILAYGTGNISAGPEAGLFLGI